MSNRKSLNISQIRRDGGTQPRAALDPDTVRNYAEAYSRGEELPPVDVFHDGSNYWLADGFHRTQGAEDAGQDEIDATIRQGTQRDAVLYSVGANATHGLPRSDEDKRRAVMRLLEDDEWSTWSDRKIAEATRTSHPFVGKLRREVYGDDIPAERTVERDGQQYTMSTGGINAERDVEMIALSNDYADLIPPLLPPAGLLYDELREQLAVDAGDSMQIRAYRRALDTLFGQQKIVKDGARYKVVEGNPDTAGDAGGNDDPEYRLKLALAYPTSQLQSYLTDKSSAELRRMIELEETGKNRKTALRELQAYLMTALSMDAILGCLDNGEPQGFVELRENVYATDHGSNFQKALQLLVKREQVEKTDDGKYQLPGAADHSSTNDDLIDHIDPVTAEVTRRPAASVSDPADPDADAREWFRKQLTEGPRHYNILSRIARTDGINMKAFLRVARAMIDDGEVDLDGRMYKLAGDTREQPALPDELSADQKAAVRDALIAAVRHEALVSTQINNAIHTATGLKLDILYLIHWLDLLAQDGKLIKTTKNGDMPRYQLNPNPPSDEEIQARRQAADIETRLDIVRQAIANRLPSEQISVTWLKRAAPAAVANAAEAGDLLTRLVDLGELRLTGGGTVNYELVEVSGTAESTDPGQDGEPVVERADEPRGRDEQQPAAGASSLPQPDEHAQQYSTALGHRAQFEKALFDLDETFKAIRVIRSIQTWHTLDEMQIDKTRQAIMMARRWMFNLDGFLEAFDDALAQIAETGEPYLEMVEAKLESDLELIEVEDDEAEVQA